MRPFHPRLNGWFWEFTRKVHSMCVFFLCVCGGDGGPFVCLPMTMHWSPFCFRSRRYWRNTGVLPTNTSMFTDWRSSGPMRKRYINPETCPFWVLICYCSLHFPLVSTQRQRKDGLKCQICPSVHKQSSFLREWFYFVSWSCSFLNVDFIQPNGKENSPIIIQLYDCSF